MDLLLVMYCQIDLIGIVFLSLLLLNQKKSVGLSSSQTLFNTLIYANIFIFVIDLLLVLLEGATFLYSTEVLFAVTTVYFISSAFIPYAWVKYTFYSSIKKFDRRHRYNFINFVFFVISLLMIVLNFFDPLLFYITDLNTYQRGPMYLVFISLPLFLSIYCSTITYQASKKQKNEARRKELRLLSTFGGILFVATYLQSIFFGVAIVWITLTFFIYVIYLNVQNRSLTLDPLTKVNNRFALDYFMDRKLKESKSSFALCMIDVDKFKCINDTFGHGCGDVALQYTAKAIIHACKDEKAFIARYGGDEFVIVVPYTSKDRLEVLQQNVEERLLTTTKKNNLPYTLKVSFGYAIWHGQQNLQDIMAEADAQMYEIKRSHKTIVH